MRLTLSPISIMRSLFSHLWSITYCSSLLNPPHSLQLILYSLISLLNLDFIQSSHTTQTDQFNVDLSIPTSNPPQPSTVVPIEQSHHLPNSSKSYTSRPCFRTSKAFVWFWIRTMCLVWHTELFSFRKWFYQRKGRNNSLEEKLARSSL